ncbi:hypothetical protein [Naasia lichenicola]|uniref:Uncharacterized protein n=1 Tax=Naasia lichenicola TaxID=2565933 RepID=A0A4S4FU08_9MICO|nr:hypothetical protein [Naasia lichenicola]THG33265.1 hypothetical protein E6C64_02625 [Naasia lichenicola]
MDSAHTKDEGESMAQVGAGPAGKARERTINFYQIVKFKNQSVNKRMKHADWQSILKAIEGKPLKTRLVTSATRTLIGEVLSVDGELHLKLMVVRDQDA